MSNSIEDLPVYIIDRTVSNFSPSSNVESFGIEVRGLLTLPTHECGGFLTKTTKGLSKAVKRSFRLLGCHLSLWMRYPIANGTLRQRDVEPAYDASGVDSKLGFDFADPDEILPEMLYRTMYFDLKPAIELLFNL